MRTFLPSSTERANIMSITEGELRDYFTGKFRDFNKALNGNQPVEISDLRQEAIAAFAKQGFPLTKSEEYRYTPLTKTLLKSLKLNPVQPTEADVIPAFNEHLIPELDGHLLVYWNGKLAYRSEDTPNGLVVEQLESLDRTRLRELRKYLATLTNCQSDAFAALNTAFFKHGSIIRIAKNTTLDKPLIIYHLSDGQSGTIYTQTRHLVVAEKNSRATLIEINKNLASEQQTFHNAVSEVFLEEDAHLHFYKIQTECSGAIIVDNTHINQESRSQLYCTTVTTGGTIIRNNLNITINGEYCESHMYGLYLIKGKDHVDNHTTVDHRIANSYSNELYKGIIDDSATGVFNGKVFVQPDAQKTNAFQSNKNLLLSDKASMNTKPQLEIWADDVKCSHGATTGQLDGDQVFYLRSRGLDEQQAKGLLLYAFATELLENISIPVLKDYLEKVISNTLYINQL